MKKIILAFGLNAAFFVSIAQMQQIKYSNAATFAIDFFNTQIGALSHYDTLLTTINQGNTWVNKLQLNGQFDDIKYASPNDLFASAIKINNGPYDRWIFKSTDNGSTWDSIMVAVASSGYQKIAFKNLNEIALYDAGHDSFLKSNFNTHTVSTHLIQAGMFIKKLQFINSDTAIALLTELIDSVNYVGNVTLKKTIDGGNTWATIWTIYDNIGNAQTHFIDESHGVIRVDSIFYYTANGGINWTSVNGNVSMNYNETLQMISPDVVYCIHDNGLLRLQLSNLTLTNSTLDSLTYIHGWCFADFIDDNNWFIAENLMSCGIYGSKIWRTGIDENNPNGVQSMAASQNQVSIFPNPCKEYLTIKFEKINNELLSVQVLNLSGEILQSKTISESATQLNLSNYTNGCYFLKCNIAGHSLTYKIILQK